MNPPLLLQQPVIAALGWALVHFLWQGSLIALVFALSNAVFEKADARTRYGLACGAMALMVLCAVGTFIWLVLPSPTESAASSGPPRIANATFASGAGVTSIHLQARLATWLPWLDCLWLAGVLVLSSRSICGWLVAQRLKNRDTSPMDSVWEERTRQLAEALKVSRPVRILKSALARLPAVVGWLRPVILVPACAFAGVDPQQLEALVAHELAHVRRHDYLVNLIQTAAETLLFYHPAVWWIGRKIRMERENCCDDLTVSACGDVLVYARALARLEELRLGESQYAMAAGGGVLLTRIRRLLLAGSPAEHSGRTWLAAALATLMLCTVWAGAHPASLRQDAHVGREPESPAEIAGQQASEASSTAIQKAQPSKKVPRSASSGSFIADLAAAGYSGLSVDQLIAFKIHQVTPGYIDQLDAAGMANLTPDELVAFRIHGVEAAQLRELQSLGFGTPSAGQAVARRIHQVTPEFLRGLKDAGMAKLSYDEAVAARIHGVTPDFIQEAMKHGFKNLTLDQLIRLKQTGIL